MEVLVAGTTYHQCTVVDSVPEKKAWYKFRCRCGNTFEARGSDILHGLKTHCGCRKTNKKKTQSKPKDFSKQNSTVAIGEAVEVLEVLQRRRTRMQEELGRVTALIEYYDNAVK